MSVVSVDYGWFEALLGDRPDLCVDCLATAAGQGPEKIAQEITRIARVLQLRERPALCAGCQAVRSVWKLR